MIRCSSHIQQYWNQYLVQSEANRKKMKELFHKNCYLLELANTCYLSSNGFHNSQGIIFWYKNNLKMQNEGMVSIS